MLVYFLHPEALSGTKEMSPSVILKRSGLMRNTRMMRNYARDGYMYVQGGDKISNPFKSIPIRDRMVIRVDGVGGVRVVLGFKHELE